MRGPYRRRRVQRPPHLSRFKPAGIPRRQLQRTKLGVAEYEAIRLTDFLGLDHQKAAERMAISRPTFTRMIEKARHKVAQALVEGRELIIEGGHFEYVETLYRCSDCGEVSPRPAHQQEQPGRHCESKEWENLAERFPPDPNH